MRTIKASELALYDVIRYASGVSARVVEIDRRANEVELRLFVHNAHGSITDVIYRNDKKVVIDD